MRKVVKPVKFNLIIMFRVIKNRKGDSGGSLRFQKVNFTIRIVSYHPGSS